MENVDQTANGQTDGQAVAQLDPVTPPTSEAAAAPVPGVPVLTDVVNPAQTLTPEQVANAAPPVDVALGGVAADVPAPAQAPELANDPQLQALAAAPLHPNHATITEHMAQIEELAKYWGGEIAIQVRNHLGFIRGLL